MSNQPAELSAELVARLQSACAQLQLPLLPRQQQQLLDYVALIEKWRQSINLTAIVGEDAILDRHLIDSLSILPHLPRLFEGSSDPVRLADIGTGAGLPGMVLAIMQPSWQIDLVDTVGKKCRFLQQVVGQLALDNVRVLHTRVEDLSPNTATEKAYTSIVCRAFSALSNFVACSAHLGNDKTVWLAMKTAHSATEEQNLPGFVIIERRTLHVPFTSASRTLLALHKST